MSKIIGTGGYCFAFEPLSENYDCIVKTIQANSLTNITVEQLAVGNHSNQKELHTIPRESAKSRFVNNIAPGEAYKFNKTVIIKTTSLDDYFKNCGIPRIDMIKIDVEGAESQVIVGAQSILTNYKPILIMEIHDCGKDDLPRHPILFYLEGIGYHIKGDQFTVSSYLRSVYSAHSAFSTVNRASKRSEIVGSDEGFAGFVHSCHIQRLGHKIGTPSQ